MDFDKEKFDEAVAYVEAHAAFAVIDDGSGRLGFSARDMNHGYENRRRVTDNEFMRQVNLQRYHLAVRQNPANEEALRNAFAFVLNE